MRQNEQKKTVLELLHFAGIADATYKDGKIVGDRAAKVWRQILPNEPPQKVEQLEAGELHRVNTYPREFWPVVLNLILAYMKEKRAAPPAALEATTKRRKRKRIASTPAVNYGQIR